MTLGLRIPIAMLRGSSPSMTASASAPGRSPGGGAPRRERAASSPVGRFVSPGLGCLGVQEIPELRRGEIGTGNVAQSGDQVVMDMVLEAPVTRGAHLEFLVDDPPLKELGDGAR